MNYFKKIIKKWKLVDKLEDDLENLAECYFLPNMWDGFKTHCIQQYTAIKKALNKLKSL